MEPDRSCTLGVVSLLLSSFLLLLGALMLCMLRCAVPGLQDAVLSEEHMEGGCNVLKVRLPCLLLGKINSLASGHNAAPCLQSELQNIIAFVSTQPLMPYMLGLQV